MVTIARPRTSYTFIDRFLATAEAYRIPTEILINKVDDLKPDEEEVMRELTEIYTCLLYTSRSHYSLPRSCRYPVKSTRSITSWSKACDRSASKSRRKKHPQAQTRTTMSTSSPLSPSHSARSVSPI